MVPKPVASEVAERKPDRDDQKRGHSGILMARERATRRRMRGAVVRRAAQVLSRFLLTTWAR